MCQSYPDVIYKQFVPNRCTCIFKIKNMQVAFLIFKYFSLLSVQIWCILGMARNMPLGQHVGGDRTQPKPCYLLFFLCRSHSLVAACQEGSGCVLQSVLPAGCSSSHPQLATSHKTEVQFAKAPFPNFPFVFSSIFRGKLLLTTRIHNVTKLRLFQGGGSDL